jgi:hypothetical protein
MAVLNSDPVVIESGSFLEQTSPPAAPHRRQIKKRAALEDDDRSFSDTDSVDKTEPRRPFPEGAGVEMTEWIMEHLDDPWLTEKQEQYFSEKYGLTRRQVKMAFNNRRQRIVCPARRQVEELQQKAQRQLLQFLAAQGVVIPDFVALQLPKRRRGPRRDDSA